MIGFLFTIHTNILNNLLNSISVKTLVCPKQSDISSNFDYILPAISHLKPILNPGSSKLFYCCGVGKSSARIFRDLMF